MRILISVNTVTGDLTWSLISSSAIFLKHHLVTLKLFTLTWATGRPQRGLISARVAMRFQSTGTATD